MTVPVMAGYIFLGITFGLLAKTNGFAWWVPIIMSTVIYSGALEFAAIPLLASAFDPIEALVLGVTLSARHLFYGIPMLKKYENIGKTKPFLIFGLTDETFSLLSVARIDDINQSKQLYISVTLLDYLYWNIGTAIGAVLGSILQVELEGLDFVLTALFVVLFIEQSKANKPGLKSGIIGLSATILSLLLFGKTSFIIVSMLIIILVLVLGRRVIDRE